MFGIQLTHRGVSRGAKNVPHRLRFTRALLQSKDFSMWFAFPCQYGSPSSAPAPGKQPLRKDLQEPLFPPAWEVHFTGGEESEPPAGKKRHPIGLCLEASIWNEWVSFSKRRPLDLLRRQKFQSLDRFSPALCQPCKDIPRFYSYCT